MSQDELQQIEIEFEGLNVTVEGHGMIRPGDIYIAKRNTGWKLLTCAKIDPRGWIIPVEKEYPYDFHECFKVIKIGDLVVEKGKS